MAMIVRTFDSECDAQAVRHAFCELQTLNCANDPRLPSGESIADQYLAGLQRQCAISEGRIFVAEHDGMVIGYAAVLSRVSADPADGVTEEARLIDLVVRESARGLGAGGLLLDAAEAFAKAAGARWMRTSVFAWNEAARAIYARRGFSELDLTLEKPL